MANRSSAGASYGGLAIADPADDPHLYATNTVPGGEIDVFDKNSTLVSSFAADSDVPFLFAPYGVQAIGNKLYVTYFNLVGSAGILDVCDLSTSAISPICRRLFASISSSAPILASPWGIVRAPHNFGVLSNMLLVGNVDDGLIHAFAPDTGHLIGTLNLADGTPFAVPGLWDLDFGSGAAANGPTNHLFFSAGPSPANDFAHLYGAGLFGVITPAGGEDSSTAP